MRRKQVVFVPDNILKLMDEKDRPPGNAGKTMAEIQAILVKKSEKEIQSEIIGFIRLRGVKQILTPRFGVKTTIKAGWPDITFAYRGLPFFFEVKAKNGRLSDEQIEVITQLNTDGWRGGVVYSVEGVKTYLDNADAETKRK